MEAEYMALAAEVKEVEIQWLVFEDHGLLVLHPTVICENGKTC